ncbi:MAG TPA: allophanate hydrolase [Verrucomicrobiae bacterium]|jgi:allophanate hydrolase|nr:allophanate hydrolase [Verrucomicrobiae bacterium]
MNDSINFDLTALRRAYADGKISPEQIAEEVLRRADNQKFPNVWISKISREQLLQMARALPPNPADNLPLYGIPFAVKDNIDFAGMPTTVGCPSFAFTPGASAAVVEKLIAAGALFVGKTNLDQFATGLVGVRSPYGICQSVFDSRHISGGSSSGSAVAVAAGLVTFALGTDTAGSGRVPAAFNNIVGHKPTRGLLSNHGVFPACRSLDCVSIFAGSCHDAQSVLDVAAGFDTADPYSRSRPKCGVNFPEKFRFGILPLTQRKFFGDAEAATLYEQSIARFRNCGGEPVEFDYSPFAQAAALLYSGPWVAERRWALGDFFDKHGDKIHPVVREIIGGAAKYDAVSTFDAQYRLQALVQIASEVWKKLDVLLLPTTGTTYCIEEVLADPVRLNSNLGHYTNFVNLLDQAALALPAGFRVSNGLPFGVTLVAPAFSDDALLALGAYYHRSQGGNIGVTKTQISEQPLPREKNEGVLLAVVGAHLRGQPLNHQLTSRRARFIKKTKTSSHYRLYALANTQPPKPGLGRVAEKLAHGIEIEIWSLDEAAFGSFVAEIPPPLGIGTLELEDGGSVKGFLCEPIGLEGARDITEFGGWLAFRQSLAK